MLESKLVNSGKFIGKHKRMGNAPSKGDWYNLVYWLIDAPVFWDEEEKGLIYLAKISESRCIKIAVDVSLLTKAHRGLRFSLPKIDTVYILDLVQEIDRGRNEYERILQMEKIR